MFVQRWLAAFVGLPLRDVGQFGSNLEHDLFDGTPSRSPRGRRHTRQTCQHHAHHVIDQRIDFVLPHQFALPLHQPQLQHLGLDLDVISVGLTARRLPALAPQVSQVGHTRRIDIEATPIGARCSTPSASSFAMYVVLQSRCSASADALTVAGFVDGRSMVTASVIVFVPVALVLR